MRNVPRSRRAACSAGHAREHHMSSLATNWLRKGGRLETLSLILGHASIRTTFDLYGHLDTTDVLAVVLTVLSLTMAYRIHRKGRS